jgi:hypothetical protein
VPGIIFHRRAYRAYNAGFVPSPGAAGNRRLHARCFPAPYLLSVRASRRAGLPISNRVRLVHHLVLTSHGGFGSTIYVDIDYVQASHVGTSPASQGTIQRAVSAGAALPVALCIRRSPRQ